MKVCSHCKKNLDESQFSKNKNKKDGFHNQCKICRKEDYRKTYDKEKKKEYSKMYYIKNKEKINKKNRNYHEKNKLKDLKISKEYYKKNKLKIIEYNENYRKNNKDKLNEYYRNKRKSNLNFRIADNIRTSQYHALKYNKKFKHAIELLGCTIEEFKVYIEKQFQDGMTWNNHGKSKKGEKYWQLDHIIPCSSFKNLDTIEEQKICFHYTNLQPLWWVDNIKKSNKLNWVKNK